MVDSKGEEDEELQPTKLLHHQRLSTLGMLAGGVAHDFNNILAGILGHITFLQAVLPQDGAHTESLQAITDGAKRASTLTNQILNFSKHQLTEVFQPVDLAKLVDSTSLLLKGALSARIDLQLKIPENELFTDAIEGKLAQVLVNLVVNARDALKTKGAEARVVVELSCLSGEQVSELAAKFGESSDSNAALDEGFQNGAVLLSVSDNGVGMLPDVKKNLFKPYFTTKGAEGNGLGLATVDAIIKEHSGLIFVQSVVDQGTTFYVLLKQSRSEDVDAFSVEQDSPVELVGGSERVLVIDDEPAVRSIVSMSLGHLGYDVEPLEDPREIEALLPKIADSYDLVICDMLMPHISGEEVFTKLREVSPEMPFIIMSGFASKDSIDRILAQPFTAFLQKPFTIDELSSLLRNFLDLEKISKPDISKT